MLWKTNLILTGSHGQKATFIKKKKKRKKSRGATLGLFFKRVQALRPDRWSVSHASRHFVTVCDKCKMPHDRPRGAVEKRLSVSLPSGSSPRGRLAGSDAILNPPSVSSLLPLLLPSPQPVDRFVTDIPWFACHTWSEDV